MTHILDNGLNDEALIGHVDHHEGGFLLLSRRDQGRTEHDRQVVDVHLIMS